MAFLDNSGDIILDAVLTDTGRKRLASADGSFSIMKFALGDDEIDYALYNAAETSATADLQIMQTPILESFTNNTSTMNSKLMSLATSDILYLSVMEFNDMGVGIALDATGGFVGVAANDESYDAMATDASKTIKGEEPKSTNPIVIDQGLNTTDLSKSRTLSSDLIENQFMVQVDNRLMTAATPTSGQSATPSFVDDDSIAAYVFTRSGNSSYFATLDQNSVTPIGGPRGNRFKFTLLVQPDLSDTSTNYYFDLFNGGLTTTINSNTFKYLDTIVRVTGMTTGYRLDIPVRIFKLTS